MSFKFISGQGTAQNVQSVIDRMLLQHMVNIDYELNINQPLGLVHSVAGPVQELVNQALGLTQQVVTQHAVPWPVAHSLGISQSVVHAGTFGSSGGVLPCEAVFDSTAVEGQPVYVVSDTNVDLAINDTQPYVIGLVFADVTTGNTGQYITEGQITKLDWTSVTGTTLLTPGAVYYLDSTAGKLTSTPTSTAGEHIVAVGRAASQTKLDIEIAEPILLC